MCGENKHTAQYPVFVYGTLRRGEHNHDLLRERTLTIQPAKAEHMQLFSLGAFPMMVQGEGVVIGELIELQPFLYAEILQKLDRLEGYRPDSNECGLYQRKLLPVYDQHHGRLVSAWSYVGDMLYLDETCPLIHDGDWVQYRLSLIRDTRFGRFIFDYQSDQSERRTPECP